MLIRLVGSGMVPSVSPWTVPTSTRKEIIMAIGPVQLLVLGFNHPNFHGEIIEEL